MLMRPHIATHNAGVWGKCVLGVPPSSSPLVPSPTHTHIRQRRRPRGYLFLRVLGADASGEKKRGRPTPSGGARTPDPARPAMRRHFPTEREQALMAAGVEPNPIVPLQSDWAAPNNRGGTRDGVFNNGVVVLAGDMLLEALNGDALAKQALKQQQARRKQQRLRMMTQQQLQQEAYVERMKWSADKGMQGKRMKAKKVLMLRRTPELSSEHVSTMPEGAIVHILETAKPTEEGIRRALVQDVWGKNSGWVTIVDADGEATMMPADEPPTGAFGMVDDGARDGWLRRGFQHDMWQRDHFPKFDSIEKQQEKDVRRTMQLQQHQKERRAKTFAQAAGKKSQVGRGGGGRGGAAAGGRGRPSASTAFRAARI